MIETRPVLRARLFFGLVLAAVGVLFTLDNFDVLDASAILRFWPLTVVAWGIVCLMGIGCARRPLMGSMVIIAGVYMQALALHGDWTSSFELGPLILVLIGVYLVGGPSFRKGRSPFVLGAVIGRRSRRGRVRVHLADAIDRGITRAVDEAVGSDASGDEVNAVAVLGSVTRTCSSAAFVGGEVSAVLGGAVIDLRAARISGGEATLEVLALMGGVELRVPDGWRIVGEVTSVLGSVDDRTRVAPAEGAPILRVQGTALLGSVEIKH